MLFNYFKGFIENPMPNLYTIDIEETVDEWFDPKEVVNEIENEIGHNIDYQRESDMFYANIEDLGYLRVNEVNNIWELEYETLEKEDAETLGNILEGTGLIESVEVKKDYLKIFEWNKEVFESL